MGDGLNILQNKKWLITVFIILLYFILVYFDYSENHSFNWIENLIQTIMISFVFAFFRWVTTNKKETK